MRAPSPCTPLAPCRRSQPRGVNFSIDVFYFYLPTLFYMLAIIPAWFAPIDAELQADIVYQTELRREGEPAMDPLTGLREFLTRQITTPPLRHITTSPHRHTTTPLHHTTATPPHHHSTTRPHRHATTPPHHHTTTPPHHRTTAPPHHRTTTPSRLHTTPHYGNATLPHHYPTKPPQLYSTMTLQHDATTLPHHDASPQTHNQPPPSQITSLLHISALSHPGLATPHPNNHAHTPPHHHATHCLLYLRTTALLTAYCTSAPPRYSLPIVHYSRRRAPSLPHHGGA